MSRLDELVAHHPVPTLRPLAWALMLLLGIAGCWAFVTDLEEVSSAPGEVIPEGQVKVIQHLEGGIIREIYVQEGALVQEGQQVLQLSLSANAVNKEELDVRLDGLILKLVRLDAEARDKSLTFPAEVAKRRPDFVRSESEAYEARKSELDSQLGSLRQLVRQKDLEIKELENKQRSLNRDLVLARRNFQISKDLLEQNLTPRVEHTKLEREMSALDGEISGLRVAVDKARAAQSEAREREREEVLKFRRAALEEYGNTEQGIARTKELSLTASEQQKRTTIRSPIEGIVKNLKYHTIGGVVQAGEAIMEIVPTGTRVVVQARLNPIDRGYVEPGQSAFVKVSTYDFVRYGGLEGRVTFIAPDSTTDPTSKEPYFRVVVETDRSYLGAREGELPITPGMQTVVDIKTGTKSVIDYLLRPALKLKHEAFRER